MKKSALLIALLMLFYKVTAQDLPAIIPPSPEASSLGKFSEVPISHYTGLPNISIPITTFEVGGKTFPVEISYHARGIKVEEIASRVGLGWALNAGGQITRQVRAADDFMPNIGYSAGSLYSDHLSSGSFFTHQTARFNIFQFHSTNPEPDSMPDQYHLQIGGLSAKFIYDYVDGEPLVQKYADIKIEKPTTHPGIFTVTDNNGFKYTFAAHSYDQTTESLTIYLNNYSLGGIPDYPLNYNTWHLTQIESPHGDIANFIYSEELSYESYRRNYDKHDSNPENYFVSATKLNSYQKQLSEIRYNYDSTNSIYSKIVFESNDNRLDTGGKELDAIKIYDHHNILLKSFLLHHSYMVSPDDTVNTNYYLKEFDSRVFKRLILDSISEVGKSNTYKPPFKFQYNSHVLPNRFSNSQDLWGYYNGKNNGKFLDFFNTNRRVDTTLAQAGMLEKITYPTKGSVEFVYEHNRGVKGTEFDHIVFPKVNPGKIDSRIVSNLDVYDGGVYKTVPFIIGSLTEPINVTSFNLPTWNGYNQNVECVTSPTNNCRFSVYLLPIIGGVPTLSEAIYIYSDTEYIYNVTPGEYQLVMDPPFNWDPNQATTYPFVIGLLWDEEVVASGSGILYASGKRIKRIDFMDSFNNLTSNKEYSYKNATGGESGVILSIANFASLDPILGNFGAYEPGPAIPGSNFNTYQGNTIGYKRVTEYYGDVQTNHGKTVYDFMVLKDSGDYLSYPITPPTDNEWLRGLPAVISHYRREANDTYKKVKSISNAYIFGNEFISNPLAPDLIPNDFIFMPTSIKQSYYVNFPLDLSAPERTFYEKTRNNYRLPFVNWLYSDSFSGHPTTLGYKIYHFTGGTLDTYKTTETLYDDNENLTLTTETTTAYNYNNHYQPAKVTSVTSDGIPIIQTFTYAQDYTFPYPTTAIGDLVQQNRILPLEISNYKDVNENETADSNELLSTTKTIYNWIDGVLEPSLVQTSKGSGSLETRVHFKRYDDMGNVLQVSKADGIDITYIYGYNKTLPIAKIENATYTQIESYVSNLQTLSNVDNDRTLEYTGAEGALREALDDLRAAFPNAMISTYTYDPLVGVTSMTDAKGYTMYYEYDDFNRLKQVKDAEGNILSKNDYHYATQN